MAVKPNSETLANLMLLHIAAYTPAELRAEALESLQAIVRCALEALAEKCAEKAVAK